MNFTLRIRPEAEADATAAYGWYEDRRTGLGEEFLLCVESAPASLAASPYRHPELKYAIHRALVRRFPYGVYYLIIEERVDVLAILHLHRDPQVWMKRK